VKRIGLVPKEKILKQREAEIPSENVCEDCGQYLKRWGAGWGAPEGTSTWRFQSRTCRGNVKGTEMAGDGAGKERQSTFSERR